MKIGVLRFPGSNCDEDVAWAVRELGWEYEYLFWHKTFEAKAFTGFILPGGFSYGDYLRSGALAARTQSLRSLSLAKEQGQPILGICNGFQILCESGFLPGALIPNKTGRFIDRMVELKNRSDLRFKIPIAHQEGRFFIPPELQASWNDEWVWLRYIENPNGSEENIAGLKKDGVWGLMPHPERAMAKWMGSDDGVVLLRSVFEG